MEIALSKEIKRAQWTQIIVDYLFKNAYEYVKRRKIETQLAACLMYEKNFSKDVFFPDKLSQEGLIMFQKSVQHLNLNEVEKMIEMAKKNVNFFEKDFTIKIFFHKSNVHFYVGRYPISPIHNNIYKKLCQDLKRNGVERIHWNKKIALVLTRYLFTLKGESHQLGIPYYNELQQIQPIKAEMFASPLNHTLDKFCSLYPDTDMPFGSIGSVFQLLEGQLEEGFYVANPPYHPRTMDMFVEKVIQKMKQVNFSVLITCPIWDYEGLCELGLNEFAEKYYKDVKYEMFEMAKCSEFYRFHILHPRHLHPYIDHKSQTQVQVVGTYSIFLSSNPTDFEKNLYNFLSQNKK